MRVLSALLLASLIGAFSGSARADEPDDQFLTIYNLIAQGDVLSSSNQVDRALAKYQSAQTALQNFAAKNANWNSSVVSFRLSYLSSRIAELSAKAPPLAGAASGPGGASPTVAAGSGPQVKLLEPGAEPRQELRLHVKPGDKESVTMTIKMNMGIKLGEMPDQSVKMPPMKLVLDVVVKDVAATGDITYEMTVADSTVEDEAGVVPQVAEAMKKGFGGLKGLTGTGVVSSRGITKGMNFKLAGGADPQVQQMMDQMKDTFSQMSSPFPEEPIGKGGKWEAKTVIKSQGMSIDQTSTFEVTSIEGDSVMANTTVSQQAANQKIQSPTMPGLKVDLTKMTGQGTGQVTFNLGQVVPPQVATAVQTEMAMSMNMGGQKQAMTMKMDVNARVEAK